MVTITAHANYPIFLLYLLQENLSMLQDTLKVPAPVCHRNLQGETACKCVLFVSNVTNYCGKSYNTSSLIAQQYNSKATLIYPHDYG